MEKIFASQKVECSSEIFDALQLKKKKKAEYCPLSLIYLPPPLFFDNLSSFRQSILTGCTNQIMDVNESDQVVQPNETFLDLGIDALGSYENITIATNQEEKQVLSVSKTEEIGSICLGSFRGKLQLRNRKNHLQFDWSGIEVYIYIYINHKINPKGTFFKVVLFLFQVPMTKFQAIFRGYYQRK